MTIERSIIAAAARLRRQREPHLVATVVRTRGSAYRRPGARMLLTQFRWISGSVSGGCLEGDIASKGWWRTRNGEPVVVTYDSRMPEGADDHDVRAAFGLGCDGVVEVMLERAGTPGRLDPLELADHCLRTQTRGGVATVIASEAPGIRPGMRVAVTAEGKAVGDTIDARLRDAILADCHVALATGTTGNRTYRSELGNVDVLVEAIVPAPRVFVFGTGHDAVPLVQLAHGLGWDVSVCTSEARVSVRQRFAGVTGAGELLVGTPAELATRIDEADRAIAIVMSHHYPTDRTHLGMLLGTHARYIGVLGPRARTMRMLSELGVPPRPDPRLHAPVGLGIGAETPPEIALAIAAEVQSVLAAATAESLRDRRGPIHAPMARSTHAVAAADALAISTAQPVATPGGSLASAALRGEPDARPEPLIEDEGRVSARAVTVDMSLDAVLDAPLVDPVVRRTTGEIETVTPVVP